jgi:starch synthase
MVFNSAEPLKVFFLSAEAEPFIKVGGLADYAGSLPQALSRLPYEILKGRRIEIRLVLPLHGRISTKKWGIHPLLDFSIMEGEKDVPVRVFTTTIQEIPVYFISRKRREKKTNPVYLERAFQNSRKYAFFSRACLELLKILDWQADLLHANDWHTAFSILMLGQLKVSVPFFRQMKSLLTIHNLSFMGGESKNVLKDFQLEPVICNDLPSWALQQPLPMGLKIADSIVAVSPGYALEIKTPQYGYGLENLIKKRGKSVSGILNGIDYQKWNPQTDECIEHHYSIDDLTGRTLNKISLLEEFNFGSRDASIPLVCIISRLDYQKGIDLVTDGYEQLTSFDFRLVVLGTGNKETERKCEQLEQKYPDRIRSVLRFDHQLANRLYAGADMILIPSRFEPCGLTQMIAMHYGCLPVARATGGLKDSIEDGWNGFLFDNLSTHALAAALKRALQIFRTKQQTWRQIQINAMNRDFSWNNSAKKYALLYLKLLQKR